MSAVDLNRITSALREVLVEELGSLGEVPVAAGREEATLVLVPGRDTAQPREIPLGALLHKIVMVRDRLRTIEQAVNSSSGLTDLERIGLQQRITRVQDALVAFSALLLR